LDCVACLLEILLREKAMSKIIPTAEPFFFPGNQIGCLLIHGFTGTPKEMRWMGEYLNGQGFTVLGVRLSGHATHPEDMIRNNYADWLASVEDGFYLLSGTAQHIYLVGLSMGGTLSLTVASYLPVRGVVAMSTPYEMPHDWRLGYTEIISKFLPYMPKTKEAPDAGWFDQQAAQDHISYPQNPVRSIGELNKLLKEMRGALPHVKVPVLLTHSRDDKYVDPQSMPAIYNKLGSIDKEMLWIEKSGHVLPRDAQRETVFKAAADFVRRIENPSHAP
jgi:carboxylesterase